MIEDLSIGDFSALLMVLFTCVITIANILLLLSTRRTIALQVKSNFSLNHQAIVTGHRDLFLGLFQQHDILKKFAEANGLDIDQWEIQIISALFINQTFIHYLNFDNGTIDASYMAGFKQDAQEVFAFPTVQRHWQRAKVVYSPAFQTFVEEELMSSSVEVEVEASEDSDACKISSPAGLSEPSPRK